MVMAMSKLEVEREFERLNDQLRIGYLEQLSSDMTHIIYDLLLLSLLAGHTLAPRCLRLLRGKVLNLPLGGDIAKRLTAVDELWGSSGVRYPLHVFRNRCSQFSRLSAHRDTRPCGIPKRD
jgi:hypothetical protein